jgi:phytoene desaturase
MKKYDVIVVGSGVGGLTSATFLAKHGARVLIVEQHFKPGGAVTSFSRQGFVFDVPSATSSAGRQFMIGRVLAELGILEKVDFVKLDRVFRFVFPDMTVDCPTDVDKYRTDLGSRFPSERQGLDRYFSQIRAITDELKGSLYAPGLFSKLAYPFRFPLLVKYASTSFRHLLDTLFKDERLKTVLSGGWQYLGLEPGRLSAMYMMIMYHYYLAEGTYVVRGGFQKLSDALADAFRGFGGELRFSERVHRISVAAGRVTGVVLSNGEEIAADAVVSNADVKRTFLELLGRDRLSAKLAAAIDRIRMSESGLMINLGVRMGIPDALNCGTVICNPTYEAESEHLRALAARDIETDPSKMVIGIESRSLSDPSLAPQGCHTLKILNAPTPYGYRHHWLRDDRGAYDDLKRRMLDAHVQAAERIIPGLSANVVCGDVSTPLTFERYLCATDGAWYDAACSPDQVGLSRMPAKTIVPGLFLTGAKSFPGHGIISAMAGGVYTADLLLEKRLLRGRCTFPD